MLHAYRVALGWAPKGHKRMEGDGRTPEGVYTLDWRNPDSRFYRSIHISYPEERDLVSAERWKTRAGGMIMIHGLPSDADPAEVENHYEINWTDGCIAVTNTEIDEIWSEVEDGTPIIIYP
ncbi:MAG: L,D-transpeptidase family protein [Alphaproteobacteria bacterium]